VKGGWHCAGPNNPGGSAENPKCDLEPKSGITFRSDEDGPQLATGSGAPMPGEWHWETSAVSDFVSVSVSGLTSSTSIATITPIAGKHGKGSIAVTYECPSGVSSPTRFLPVSDCPETGTSTSFTDPFAIEILIPKKIEPTYKYYGLSGKTLYEVSAAALSTGRKNFARTSPSIPTPDVIFRETAVFIPGCNVYEAKVSVGTVNVDPSASVELPNWVNEASGTCKARAEWDRAIAATRDIHEKGHVDRILDEANERASAMAGIGFKAYASSAQEALDLAKEKANSEIDKRVTVIQKKWLVTQNEYDALPPIGTGHGATQGAKLDLNQEGPCE
jgi:predicted secreted Zn-dependent protease